MEGARLATGADTPTYAEDLMGEVVGPMQTLVTQFFLLVACKAVGLHIVARSCLGLRVTADEGAVRRRLAAFPFPQGGPTNRRTSV
eukprot:10212812-Alexandrium_andersonii.AAC.1